MNAWTGIKAKISQLFEPTLWELEIFGLQETIKRPDKAITEWEAKYWRVVEEGNAKSARVAELETDVARVRKLASEDSTALDEKLRTLRAELEAVTAERDQWKRKNHCYFVEVEQLKKELAALRQGATVPVKVRASCTWQEVQAAYYRHQSGSPEGQCWHQVIECVLAHAVIDGPAGVPSVKELAESVCSIPDKNGNLPQRWLTRPKHEKEFLIRAATAIRDTVLASLPTTTPHEPTAAEVEALARDLCDNWRNNAGDGIHNGAYDRGGCNEEWNNSARAAFKHFRGAKCQ